LIALIANARRSASSLERGSRRPPLEKLFANATRQSTGPPPRARLRAALDFFRKDQFCFKHIREP
jgi:hypothetical protein